MDIQLMGVAFGLASLAGINLYLTVFVTGLAINQHWITLAPQYEHLAPLGHPAVVIIAGVLYFIQFFADKIPWVDSLWDFIHTVIRPIGGAALALHTFGKLNPVFDVIIILLAGGMALTTHGLKASTRLVTNSSPEPFSNIALSVGEDVTVVGGLALIYFHPVIALAILIVVFSLVAWFGPKILRVLRTRLWFAWRKLNAPAFGRDPGELGAKLPALHDAIFTRLNLLGEKVEWTAPCISTAMPRIPANLSGWIVATVEEPAKLTFVAKNGLRRVAETLDIAGFTVEQESKFLTENLVLHHPDKKTKHIFLFDRSRNALVKNIAASLRQRLAEPVIATPAPAVAEPAQN